MIALVHGGQTRFKHWSEESKLKAVKAEHFIVYAMLSANQWLLADVTPASWHGWCGSLLKHSQLESILECIHMKTSKHTSSHSQIHTLTGIPTKEQSLNTTPGSKGKRSTAK